ncbi:hypothetical protein CSA56_16925 [candidate division KSB3 bacterium]|uniref:Uncharacterized protein n=1 Tax=candidate division KSB3 bacterium TaxID=2044937 RepID=A0A2G6K8E5_9BACT|nr:MAG: hypothetical protein CSA56_16925 [candidate division KSB3 bacterium]
MQTLQDMYDMFWQKAVVAFRAGEYQLDRHLARRWNDRRRGLSLIIRSDKQVATRMVEMLEEYTLTN